MSKTRYGRTQFSQAVPCAGNAITERHVWSSWKGYDATTGKRRKTWTPWVCCYCGIPRKEAK